MIDTEEQRSLVHVNFRLGGAAAFFALPLEETRDELVDLGELWGRDGAVLRERLLEAAPAERLDVVERVLLDRLQPAHEPDPAVAVAVRALERGYRVSDVTARLDVLPKRFVRRFRARIGLTPKRFARVRRLQRVLGAVVGNGRVEWARRRGGARVLRPGPSHPRLPGADRAHADRLPAAGGDRVEPRPRRLTLFSKTNAPAPPTIAAWPPS